MADEGRVAIHLRSLADQMVHVGRDSFAFREGERIHIEDSWKYTLEGFRRLAAAAGYRPLEVWTDEDQRFSVHLLEVEG